MNRNCRHKDADKLFGCKIKDVQVFDTMDSSGNTIESSTDTMTLPVI